MQDAPWLQHYPAGIPRQLPAVRQHLSDWFTQTCERWSALAALQAGGRCWTYAELAAETESLRHRLQQAGIRRGQSVGLLAGNSPQAIFSYFALWQCGAVVVPLSPLDAPPQLARKLADSQAVFVLTQNLTPFIAALSQIADSSGLEAVLVSDVCACASDPLVARQHLQAAGLLADLPAHPLFHFLPDLPLSARSTTNTSTVATSNPISNTIGNATSNADTDKVLQIPDCEQPALIQYTGGTTGEPKGAPLSHSNLLSACEQLLATTRTEPPVLRRGQERLLLVLPVFHIYALTAGILFALSVGAEVILHARFDPDAVLQDLRQKEITIFPGVPTMYAGLMMHPDAGRLRQCQLRFCCSGGAPLPAVMAEQFEQLSACRLLEGWGMTEAGPSGTFTPRSGQIPAGSCGLPVPGLALKIVRLGAPEITEAAGIKGEICIRGPNVIRQYWRRTPDAESFTADGFLRTGDIGYLDQDGYLYIVDRCKDMLITGGMNVYPRLIEEAIYRHPDVAEVMVIGMPDTYHGQLARAGIVMKPGRTPLTLTVLRAFLSTVLGKHELPAQLVIRDSLPKTAIGKLSKKDFLAEEMAKAASGADCATGLQANPAA